MALPRAMALRRVAVLSSARTLELLQCGAEGAWQYVASARGAPEGDACFRVEYEAEPDCVAGVRRLARGCADDAA